MSEVMTFSIKAQVYILDPDLQTWSPHTFSVLPVSFYSDPASGRTRIIAMENSEPKVNSLLLPEMAFSRPSETFGQWLDPTSGDLYGLNFTSKADAENFESTFKDGVEKASKAAPAASAAAASPLSDDPEKLKKEIAELKKQLTEKDREAEKKIQEASSKGNSSQSSLNTKVDTMTVQIKSLTTENENFKSQIASLKTVAGAGQDAEAKLKTANSDVEKLKAALKVSSTNVDAWQRQLAGIQKENQDLKTKLQKMAELQKGFASALS